MGTSSLSPLPTIGVLGTTMVARIADGRRNPARLSAQKERSLLAALTLDLRRVVSVDQLADAVWAGDPPRSAQLTLQGYIAQLRRVLEPDRPARTAARLLRTEGDGYVLDLPDSQSDAHAFELAVGNALIDSREDLRPPWKQTTDHNREETTRRLASLEYALSTWRGAPYVDLEEYSPVPAERARLEGLRISATELVAVLHLALGDRAKAISKLESLVKEYPLRESLSALLALALARSGRQAESLTVVQDLSSTLREELGIDPSPAVKDLHIAILTQDIEYGLGRSSPTDSAAVVPSLRTESLLDIGHDTLSSAAVGELMWIIAGIRLPIEESVRLRRRTGGNPYLVVAFAQSDDPLSEEVPGLVADVVDSWLRNAPDHLLDVLRTAAAIGPWFDAGQLSWHMDPAVPIVDLLEFAAERNLIRPTAGGAFEFRAEVVRELLTIAHPVSLGSRTRSEQAPTRGPGPR